MDPRLYLANEIINIILMTDAYKLTHWKMYPKGLEYLYSYFESRGGVFPSVIFFGLQMILKKYFVGNVLTQAMINEADTFCRTIFGQNLFNKEGWQYILDKYKGKLPLRIMAVPEGMEVPTSNVLMTVENTDPQVPWLTNWAETVLVQSWYPTTVATMSYYTKKIIGKWCAASGTELSPFHLNDFGFRGVSSVESAGIGGCSHLVPFSGTDNLEGIKYAMDYYNFKPGVMSVPATEHSTTTIYGKDGEPEAYKTFLTEYFDGTLSIVIDSWNTLNAVMKILGTDLKDLILARNGKTVFRPDSGDPVEMTVMIYRALWECFGGTIRKGFKVLNPAVGIIYGDGINYLSIDKILQDVHASGFATDNLFGEGGGLLQQVDRDTQRFAFKASHAVINGLSRDVFKQPADDMSKASKRGKLKLIRNIASATGISTVCDTHFQEDNILQKVYENGELLIDHDFNDVRALNDSYFRKSPYGNMNPDEIFKFQNVGLGW